jgi:sugar phosphate isomerase/epimerase
MSKMNKKLSIMGYSFHILRKEGRSDIYHFLEMVKNRYRVDAVDIWNGYIPEEDVNPTFAKEIKKSIDELGLAVPNLCIDGRYVPWAPTAEERAGNHQRMLDYIEFASIIGANTIRVDFCPWGTKDEMTPEAMDMIVERYREYAEICHGKGMKIGPENHFGWDNTPKYLKAVKEAVNHPGYGHLFHFTNFQEEPELGKEVAMSYVMHTHVPPWTIMDGVAKTHMRDLLKAGYDGYWGVEIGSPIHWYERVAWHIAVINIILAELEEELYGSGEVVDFLGDLLKPRNR